MAQDDVADWLDDDRPPPSQEEVQVAWQQLLAMDLAGKQIVLESSAGDSFEVWGYIERVFVILGVGVAFKVDGIDVYRQGQDELCPCEGSAEPCYIVVDLAPPPQFRSTDILLPRGGICIDVTGETIFGGCYLSVGYIMF